MASDTADVMVVIVLTTSVTRQIEQSSSHHNQRKKLRRQKLEGPGRNKHGLTRKINNKDTVREKPPQETKTHDKCRRHTKPTLPTRAHSC